MSCMKQPAASPPPPRTCFLLQQPHKWTRQHYDLLKVRHECNVPSESIVSSTCLPHDGDQELEAIAADLTKPDRKDLANFACWHDRSYAKSYFISFFDCLGQMMEQEENSESDELLHRNYSLLSKKIMSYLIDTILRFVHTSTRFNTSSDSRIPFRIQSCNVKGILKCAGALCLTSDLVKRGYRATFPLTIFTVLKYHDKDTGIIRHEVPQVLIQALLAFQKNPALDVCKAFVLRMEGTKLQLSAASISRAYIDTLSQGKHLRDGFTVRSSKAYDLREPEERREALRLLIGLLRYLDATQSNG